MTGEEEAGVELRDAFNRVSSARGKVANIMRVHSLHPETMTAHLDFYRSLMFGRSPLSRKTRELLATVVSSLNRCEYCVSHHSAALEFYLKDSERIRRIIADYKTVKLPDRESAMLEYAEKLTLRPSEVRREDVERLRCSGLTDEEILDANLIIGYFNFVNRVALGLGVEFDEKESSGYRY